MDYKKKYEKLVDAVKVLRDNNPSDEGIHNWVNDNVPELKESEDERIKKEIIEYIKTGTYHKKWIEWLENVGKCKDKEINNFDVLPGFYKCVHRMFDGTPEGKLLFDVGNIYKCLSKHSRAEFEVSYGHSVYLEDPVVCKHFIPFESQIFTNKDVDDAYLKGVTDTKNEIEKQYEANYQIRKDIATFIFNYKGDIKDRAKWMNYLGIKVSFVEKQGEKPQGKSALEAIREEKVDNANKIEPKDYSSIDPYFGKPIDNVEPKFKVGDWITNGDYTRKVISVDNFDYTLQNQWGECVEDTIDYVNKAFHIWTIQDAKVGDVLATKDKNFTTPFVAIYKSIGDTVYDNITFNSHCFIGFDGNFYGGEEVHSIEDIYPATREQRKLLFQKMKESGYEWDAEKKELRKEEVK